jgi:hypothetical protein
LSPASQAKTLWVSFASPGAIPARSPKCDDSLFGFNGFVTSQSVIPPLPFLPHCSLFMTSIWPVNCFVVTLMTCMPSPGRVSCDEGMKPTSTGFSMSLMSTTHAPASGDVMPPFSGPAQSGSPQLARYA